MRAVIIVLIVIILAIIAAIVTGFLDINQIRGARAPQISTTHNGVVAKGGETPGVRRPDRVGEDRHQTGDGGGALARGRRRPTSPPPRPTTRCDLALLLR